MTRIAIQVGDVVRLKSGGPKMTVTSIVEKDSIGFKRGHVECRWFDTNIGTGISYLPAEALIKIEETTE